MGTVRTIGNSEIVGKPNESIRLVTTAVTALLFGLWIGTSVPAVRTVKNIFSSSILTYSDVFGNSSLKSTPALVNHTFARLHPANSYKSDFNYTQKIYVPTNPKGAEGLPPGIVVSESDLYQRRLWGHPSEDLPTKPKYLVTITVGYEHKDNVNAMVHKFSENFTILLFHYDGRVGEWDEFEWSKRAIHVSVRRQTKWWYAKRFLHPDIVASYEYVFIWDEDLGLEHFDAEEYIKLVKKHGLDISQPGVESSKEVVWRMTKRKEDSEVHKQTEEREGYCYDPHLPPCAAFVEIMAPVFSRNAWRCVWHVIQNDLIHGWGLDYSLRRCVSEPANERMGVVDTQWVVHLAFLSLGNQGKAENGKAPREGVRERCHEEWLEFKYRITEADNTYYKKMGITPPIFTVV